MATKIESVKSFAQFDDVLKNPSHTNKLIVLFFFNPLDGICKRIRPNLDFWSQQVKYKDHVLFIACDQESSNPDIFEKYDIEAIPTFLFFKNKEKVGQPVSGHDVGRFNIEAIMDHHINGTT